MTGTSQPGTSQPGTSQPGTSQQGTAGDGALGGAGGGDATFVEDAKLLRAVGEYLSPDDMTLVERVLALAHEIAQPPANEPVEKPANALGSVATSTITPADAAYATSVALTLAEALHIDTITLAAVLLYQWVEAHMLSLEDVRTRLGGAFGGQVAETIGSIERFDTLQRPGATLRRNALIGAETEEAGRGRRRGRERQRRQDADALRKMFVAMAEDPRVVVIKIADQLRRMRAVRRAAEAWRAHDQAASAPDAAPHVAPFTPPAWTREECRMLAEETREVFAPLAGRLGMGRVEGELEDLAFAVLEPEEYRWLYEAVAEETSGRRAYVEQVTQILRREMEAIGINAEVSGRVKHLYSIYKKVERMGTRDLSALYDILAFRILVQTVGECYLALGHVHELWRPNDGRIKDFIASPKPNGYQSLHTTVFCLDNQLAEIQIRTHEMHQLAEYGVAMHWYYKDVGDSASADAHSLQTWVQQVRDWQQDLHGAGQGTVARAVEAVKGDVLREQIYVFTPAGDAKELPAGSTPLDFAYRVHTDLGHHVSGVRITTDDGNGRVTKKLVPLDYELKNGDIVEVLKRNDAHPSRDWLRVVRTKLAHDRIMRYLKEHERDIDAQRGRDRLDRELRAVGLRKGYDALDEDDLHWLARELGQGDEQALLVALATEKLRISVVIAKVRERLKLLETPEPEQPETTLPLAPARSEESGANVEGLSGMLTHLANCCNPLPGDDLCGFITRGRGVVIHRADCPNLRHLLIGQPERAVAVAWPRLDGKETFRAPIVVEGNDRTGLLRDVTGAIATRKLNLLKVDVVTRARPERAIINAVLEIQRPEELEAVLRDIRAVPSVLHAQRKEPGGATAAARRARK